MERRKTPRYQVQEPILLSYRIQGIEHDDVAFLINLSLGGAAIHTNHPYRERRSILLHVTPTFHQTGEPLRFEVLECRALESADSFPFLIRVRFRDRRRQSSQVLSRLLNYLQWRNREQGTCRPH